MNFLRGLGGLTLTILGLCIMMVGNLFGENSLVSNLTDQPVERLEKLRTVFLAKGRVVAFDCSGFAQIGAEFAPRQSRADRIGRALGSGEMIAAAEHGEGAEVGVHVVKQRADADKVGETMLKEWLDANLPGIVESMVNRRLAGIVLAPVDRKALVNVVERAATAGSA